MVRRTETTSEGLYRLDNLPSGNYDLTLETKSFVTAEARKVKLQVGDHLDINFGLKLTGDPQSVLVTTEVPLVETTKKDLSTIIDDKDTAVLPTTAPYQNLGGVAKDYLGLAASAPGIKYDYTGSSFDIIGPGYVTDHGININVDGGNISDQIISARDALGASVEEVKEFQALTNNYDAEYGQAGNIIVNVVTRSGTNEFHGDFHAYFQGRNLSASSFFQKNRSCTKGPQP